jgi:hypothetical protein
MPGGPLNDLNEMAGTNRRSKTVPVMALVSMHRPLNASGLERLIEEHYQRDCLDCTIRSYGTVRIFGRNLYEAQFTCIPYIEKYGHYRKIFHEQDCYDFMYRLFCKSPIRGFLQEQKSMEFWGHHFKAVVVTPATQEEDFEYGVDYRIQLKDLTIGIQVKSRRFFKNRYSVQINTEKQSRYHYPVLYHVYSEKDFTFDNDSTQAIMDILRSVAS